MAKQKRVTIRWNPSQKKAVVKEAVRLFSLNPKLHNKELFDQANLVLPVKHRRVAHAAPTSWLHKEVLAGIGSVAKATVRSTPEDTKRSDPAIAVTDKLGAAMVSYGAVVMTKILEHPDVQAALRRAMAKVFTKE